MKHYVNYLGAPESFELNMAANALNQAYPEAVGCFHVGSSITRRDYRDVDVRMILHDDDFERMFPGLKGNGWLDARFSLLCASISCWLKARTGLPIGFQFQSMTEANRDYPDGERNALGLFYACGDIG